MAHCNKPCTIKSSPPLALLTILQTLSSPSYIETQRERLSNSPKTIPPLNGGADEI